MNKGFHLIRSNRLESLAEHFIAQMLSQQKGPFDRVTVVTQTPAIARWLQLEIAKQMGISANFEMVRPESFLRSVLLDETNLFVDVTTSVWKLFDLLNTLPDSEGFSSVRSFVIGSDLKRFQLAEKVAELFDQYAVFRPEMIESWNRGELKTGQPDEIWQLFLWQNLKESLKDSGSVMRDEVLQTMFQQAEKKKLTSPIYLFGVSSMPHYQLNLFDALSKESSVILYHLTPSEGYFGDMRKNEVEQLQLIEQLTPDKQPLLAELGSVAKNFVDWMQEIDVTTETDLFSQQKGKKTTLLQTLQSDMTHLTPPAPFSAPENDNSITIASTPSSYRECEILQNTLLDALAADRSLQPRDIIVMTPNIQEYAPYIDAVFGHTDAKQAIPYSIADRIPPDERSISAALQTILSLKGGRLTKEDVVTLFRTESIHKQFNIKSQSDIDMLATWVERVGIDWGIDETHRGQLGFPKKQTNSWKFGKERMILGLSMTESAEETLFHSIIPFEGVKGRQAVILGNFISFLDTLFDFILSLNDDKTLAEWADIFDALLENLFAPSVEKEQLLIALSRETKRFRDFSSEATVSFDTVRYIVTQLLDSRSSFRGFISGGVTFCEMKPMRAIPFKMIALIGMNESSFPRSDHRLSYDLIGQIPRAGDRSIRENDRHLFLELLLSARERLHISYTGINHRSGDELFPSVLVNRMLSLICSLYKKEISLEKHPIHPFSSRYFTSDSDLTSYNSVDEQCARQFSSRTDINDPDNRLVVKDAPLPENRMTLNLFQLANFFSNPAYYFAKQVLKLRLPETPEEEATTTTKFSLSALERWGIVDELLKRYEKAESVAQVDTIYYIELAGSGKLPWGKVGKQLFQELTKTAWTLFKRSEQLRNSDKPEELFVDYHFHDNAKQLTLISRFSGIYPTGRILHNPSKSLGTSRQIHYLLQHLMMQTKTDENLHIFYGISRKALSFHHLGLEQPQRILDEIINYFFEGLTHPLPFLPDFSAHLYSIIAKGERDPQTALKMALKHHYDTPSFFPKPFESEALTMSGLEDASLETATKACDMASLIFGTLHTATRGH